ncbi:hypothetical protein MTO96_017484 [Rhipicephalus appendiculatus]
MEVQVKSFAPIQRLGSPIVVAVLEGALRGDREALEKRMSVPCGLVEAAPVKTALNLKDKTFILDVAIAWDAKTKALEAVCAPKRQKYQPLVPVLRAKSPGKEIKGARQEIAALAATSRRTDIEAAPKRQRAAGDSTDDILETDVFTTEYAYELLASFCLDDVGLATNVTQAAIATSDIRALVVHHHMKYPRGTWRGPKHISKG